MTVLYPHLEQVVETPGEDDDVVDIQEGYNHNGGVANTCKGYRFKMKKQNNSEEYVCCRINRGKYRSPFWFEVLTLQLFVFKS